MVRDFLRDEAGSPTIESILWIVIFVVAMMALVIMVKNKVSGSLKNGTDSMTEEAYRQYCENKGDGTAYKGGYVNEGLGYTDANKAAFALAASDTTQKAARHVGNNKAITGTLVQRLHTYGVADNADGLMAELTPAQIATGLIRPACEF